MTFLNLPGIGPALPRVMEQREVFITRDNDPAPLYRHKQVQSILTSRKL